LAKGSDLYKRDAFEGMDADGPATFDVTISLPFIGMLVRYQGWLEEVENGGRLTNGAHADLVGLLVTQLLVTF